MSFLNRKTKPSADRLPPFDLESEQGALACILWSPRDCLAECRSRLIAGPLAFYDLRHQLIYQTMLEIAERLDVITLQARLRETGRLDEAGGLPYLAALPDTTPSADNLSYYLETLSQKYTLPALS